jgi:hypothetical protein
MKLTWSQTGDSLEIDVVNPEVIEYWVDQINHDQKNQFICTDSVFPDTQPLVDALTATNTVLEKFKLGPLMDPTLDWYDQNNLNLLHERWVKLQHKHKNIVRVITGLPNNIIKQFHAVNELIHKIEKMITVKYINDEVIAWQTPNIFGPEILMFGTWQAEIRYQNLGRSNYEKWKNYDGNIIDTDTNNFTHIGGMVNFNIERPTIQLPPINYVEYCQQHNISSYGNKLPLGNFKIAITELRHIFNKNVNIKHNTITFKV